MKQNRSLNASFIVPVVSAVLLAAAHAAQPVSVVTLDGDEVKALYDAQSSSIKGDGGALPLASLAQVMFGEAPRVPPKLPEMRLHSGDQLGGIEILAWTDAAIEVKTPVLERRPIPTASVNALIFYGATKKMPAELDGFLSAKAPTEDLLLNLKGEQINGFVEKADTKSVTLNSGGQSRAYPFDQLAALRFAVLQKPAVEAATARVSLLDGTRLSVKLDGFIGEKLAATFQGQRVEVPLNVLARIDSLNASLAYLSDWEPSAVEEQPLVAGEPTVFAWRKDRSVTNAPLKIGERTYERGIGMHSGSRLSFDLRGEYVKFIAEAGLDASAPAKSGCVWKVLLDGKEAAQGSALSGGPGRELRLDVANVRKLDLVCEDLPGGDGFGARLNFGMTRLVKRAQ